GQERPSSRDSRHDPCRLGAACEGSDCPWQTAAVAPPAHPRARLFRRLPTRIAAVAAAVLAVAVLTGAGADGDPASDVLPEQPVFYGSALDLESRPAAQLDAL